jgi:hypothetical protein
MRGLGRVKSDRGSVSVRGQRDVVEGSCSGVGFPVVLSCVSTFCRDMRWYMQSLLPMLLDYRYIASCIAVRREVSPTIPETGLPEDWIVTLSAHGLSPTSGAKMDSPPAMC